MAKAKGGLGRGLGALLPEYEELVDAHDAKDGIVELDLEKVFPTLISREKTLTKIN